MLVCVCRVDCVGAKGYTSEKVCTLLNLLREHLPIGGDGWQLVADEYNKKERVCLTCSFVFWNGACEMGLFDPESKFFRLCGAYMDPCIWGGQIARFGPQNSM